MLNRDRLNNLREENHEVYQKLLIEVAPHSDDSQELLDAVEAVSKQMSALAEVIEHLLEEIK